MKRVALAAAIALASLAATTAASWALSEIQREDLPAPTEPGSAAPQPGAPATPSEAVPETQQPGQTAEPEDGGVAEPARPEVGENGPLPDISYDLAALPEPVRRMHDLLLEACGSADIERLRGLIDTGEDATQLSLADIDGDVIEFLKQSSGDGKGLELLAILEEVLSAGYVHLEPGTDEELYVWPYFFAIPLDRLTGRQQVELYKIVTSGDVEEMRTFGAYIFYRVGITPEGRWAFFVAGD